MVPTQLAKDFNFTTYPVKNIDCIDDVKYCFYHTKDKFNSRINGHDKVQD